MGLNPWISVIKGFHRILRVFALYSILILIIPRPLATGYFINRARRILFYLPDLSDNKGMDTDKKPEMD
jgi:hypothetical protein